MLRVFFFQVLYNIALLLAQPFFLTRLLIKSKKNSAYRQRILERYGFFQTPSPAKNTIWVHAVSLGESIAAGPLIKRLYQNYPNYRLVITTTTPTGSRYVQQHYGSMAFHVYVPYDLPGTVKRFLRKIKPHLIILIETELWPNIIHISHRHSIPILVANARLSFRSFCKYQRFQWLLGSLFTKMHIAAQHEADAERFSKLGVPSSKIQVLGSIKYDLHIDPIIVQQGKALRATWLQNKPSHTKIITATSTHPGEERLLFPLFKTLKKSNIPILFVLIPRHKERFDDVYHLCTQAQLSTVRRSTHQTVQRDTDLLLADTLGEVLLLLSASDIVFMGGSLIPRGGHNMMEPAALGLPQVTGAHIFNFQHIAETLQKSQALVIAQDAREVFHALNDFLHNATRCQQMGERGKAVIARERGAVNRHMNFIATFIEHTKHDTNI